MGKQALSTGSRYGWRWLQILLGGLSWLSLGCSPSSLSMLLMPFNGDNSMEPEYKLFTKDKEITLAIVSNFSRPEINPELRPVETELADETARAIRKRCADNKNKIKIVPAAQVRSQHLKLRQIDGEPSLVELGKVLKADYVLDLSILSVSLYEKSYYPRMYRGKTELDIKLYKMEVKEGENLVFSKDLGRIYPRSSGPIDSTSIHVAAFRRSFLGKVGDEISKTFIAYAPDEAHQLE